MAFKDKMSEVMLFSRDSKEITSGVHGPYECYICRNDSFFTAIGQRGSADIGGYVQRSVCQRAECILQAIQLVREKIIE